MSPQPTSSTATQSRLSAAGAPTGGIPRAANPPCSQQWPPLAFLFSILLATTAIAQGPPPPPPIEIDAPIGVTEHLGAKLPFDQTFEDEKGQTIRLGQFFQPGKPVILQLGYYECPMLCTLVSQGIVQSLKELNLAMGSEFQVVMVSIDPSEISALALAKKQNSLKAYGRPTDADGWHFLVGKKSHTRQLADAVGFRYKWDEQARQFSHPAVIAICTPDGRISQYLYGVKYDAKTLRQSLLDAAAGKIGAAGNPVPWDCKLPGDNEHKYSKFARIFMQAGGGLTVLVLIVVFWRLFRRERHQPPQSPAQPAKPTP